jgi:hypothetical protein
MAERRIGHCRLEHGIVDAVELQGEEQQMDRGVGDALLHVAVELGARRIAVVAGIEQRGVGVEPAEAVVDRFVALHRVDERTALPGRQRGELALEVGLEGGAVRVALFEVALERGIVHAGIEVGEVPLGQRAELGVDFRLGSGFRGGLGGRTGGHERIPWLRRLK